MSNRPPLDPPDLQPPALPHAEEGPEAAAKPPPLPVKAAQPPAFFAAPPPLGSPISRAGPAGAAAVTVEEDSELRRPEGLDQIVPRTLDEAPASAAGRRRLRLTQLLAERGVVPTPGGEAAPDSDSALDSGDSEAAEAWQNWLSVIELPAKDPTSSVAGEPQQPKPSGALPLFGIHAPAATAASADVAERGPPAHRQSRWVLGEDPQAREVLGEAAVSASGAWGPPRTPALVGSDDTPATAAGESPAPRDPPGSHRLQSAGALVGPSGFSGGLAGQQALIEVDRESLAPSRRGSRPNLVSSAFHKVTAPRPSRWAALALPASWVGLALLLAGALVPWAFRARTRSLEPEPAGLEQAAAKVASQLKPGDALAFLPAWAAHEGWRFDEVWRSHGAQLIDDMLTGEPLDLWDAGDHKRLWVVATHGKLATLDLKAAGAHVVLREDLGHGTGLALYDLPPVGIRFDFRRKLAEGHARIRGPEEPASWRDCAWRRDPVRGRHACNGLEFQDVWQTIQEVGGTRRDCIFVHPPGERGTLQLRFGSLPAATTLQGRLGNRLWAVRHGDVGSPLRFRVAVGERTVWEKTLATDDFAWYSWSVALGPEDAGKDVAFEVSADKADWREACFDARLLGPPEAAPAAPVGP